MRILWRHALEWYIIHCFMIVTLLLSTSSCYQSLLFVQNIVTGGVLWLYMLHTCLILKITVYQNFHVLKTLILDHFSSVGTSKPNKLKYDCPIRVFDCFIRVF